MPMKNRLWKMNCEAASGRLGMTLVEVIVSGILLGAVMTIAVPTLSWVVRERRAADRRLQALFAVENVMERFTTRKWDEISDDSAKQIELSQAIRDQLPGAVLKCAVHTKPNAPDEKRIAMELTWSGRMGKALAPVRLTTWVYRGGRRQ